MLFPTIMQHLKKTEKTRKKKQMNQKINYPLKNGAEMHNENVVKLLSLLRIWSRILGLPELKPAVALSVKINDMKIAMDVPEELDARAIELTDEAFKNIKDPVEMMLLIKNEDIFLRLKSYYQTVMNISDSAVNNFITYYEENFHAVCAYEIMIDILRKEITQNFSCEDEKKTFTNRIKGLNEANSEWRDRVHGDWRVKEEMDKKEGPK